MKQMKSDGKEQEDMDAEEENEDLYNEIGDTDSEESYDDVILFSSKY